MITVFFLLSWKHSINYLILRKTYSSLSKSGNVNILLFGSWKFLISIVKKCLEINFENLGLRQTKVVGLPGS